MELRDILSPFQEFKDVKVGADLDFLCIPDAPFRLSFIGIERSAIGAIDIEASIERIETPVVKFRHSLIVATVAPSAFIPGPVGYVKIPRGYGIRISTTGIAGGETVKARIVIEKLVDY